MGSKIESVHSLWAKVPPMDPAAGSLNEGLAEQLTLWESFLFMVWTVGLFCRKAASFVTAWAGDSFLQSLRRRAERGNETHTEEGENEIVREAERAGTAAPDEEGGDSSESVQQQDREDEGFTEAGFSSAAGTQADDLVLMPPLPNSLVSQHIWLRLVYQWRLPHELFYLAAVNRWWRRFVEGTLEWHAANFVRLDLPGYHDYIQRGQGRGLPLMVRVRQEIRNFRYLVAERLEQFQPR
jgi:hypothetical protein